MNDFERITRINEQDAIVQECEAALMLAFGMVAFGMGWATSAAFAMLFFDFVPWWHLYPGGVILLLAGILSYHARRRRLKAWNRIGILERPE